ncbi:Early nodulin-like protein [Quillaja saponaria]|uniref:Early nodulin-like protein n=1 Tax=Quillaja saponaria TaxID=32244 RepID=A0AAD7KZ37_QUISA|nr:Early nodulin-like protein [Quillaja saponaria]
MDNMKAVCVFGFCYLMLLVQKGAATVFVVGGSKGWSVPSDALSYNQWAEKSRFQIGDSIAFNYKPGQDSVLLVNKDEYNNCNTAASAPKYSDGHTVFKFNNSGPHYFISGNKDNCLKNEKLVVIVLAHRSTSHALYTNETSPVSPPLPGSTELTPTPAPAGVESPPAGAGEINPTPAPVSDESPPSPSGASSILLGFGGLVGVFMASYILV